MCERVGACGSVCVLSLSACARVCVHAYASDEVGLTSILVERET